MMSLDDICETFETLETADLQSSPNNLRVLECMQQSKILKEENAILKNCLRVLQENTDAQTGCLIASIIGLTDIRPKEKVSEYDNFKEVVSSLSNEAANEGTTTTTYMRYERKTNYSPMQQASNQNQRVTTPVFEDKSVEIPVLHLDSYNQSKSRSPSTSRKTVTTTTNTAFNADPKIMLDTRSSGFIPRSMHEPEWMDGKDEPKTRPPPPPEEFRDSLPKSPKSGHRLYGEPIARSTPSCEQRCKGHGGHLPPPGKESVSVTEYIRSSSPARSSRSPARKSDHFIKKTSRDRSSRSVSPELRENYSGMSTMSTVSERTSRSVSPSLHSAHEKGVAYRHASPAESQSPKRNFKDYRSQSAGADQSMKSPRQVDNPFTLTSDHYVGITTTLRPSETTFSSSCSEQLGQVGSASRSSTPHNVEDIPATDDEESYPQSYRILGEIAFQLERRILDYVFCGDKTKLVGTQRNRRRFYGYTVSNIPAMIAKEAEAEGGKVDPVRECQIRCRLDRIITNLGQLGYDMEKHGQIAQKIINKYGLLGTIPNKNTMDAFGMNDEETLRQLVTKITCDDEERANMLILLECLLLLSRQDGKPILLW